MSESFVTVDPAVRFGDPCVGIDRLDTRTAAHSAYSGTSISEIAETWEVSERDVLVACWYEARHGHSRKLRKAWRDWLVEAELMRWRGELPSPPPSKEGS